MIWFTMVRILPAGVVTAFSVLLPVPVGPSQSNVPGVACPHAALRDGLPPISEHLDGLRSSSMGPELPDGFPIFTQSEALADGSTELVSPKTAKPLLTCSAGIRDGCTSISQ